LNDWNRLGRTDFLELPDTLPGSSKAVACIYPEGWPNEVGPKATRSENPISKIKKFKELSNPDGSDQIKNQVLSARETEKLFCAAQSDPEIIPFLALWFFAGIRRATLEKLDWSAVKSSEKRVIVPRYAGKNDTRYRVTLSDNLVEWLRPHVCESGSLFLAICATLAAFGWSRSKDQDATSQFNSLFTQEIRRGQSQLR
jgi:hypothetical protein